MERIEENRLDALYLFINETLRDRPTFARFFANLLSVLPHNWSIQRVEVGHEFLGMVTDQPRLFAALAELDSLRTLIFSDGYVQRKDKGTIHTQALLAALPRARNLSTLDIQRLELSDDNQVDTLASLFDILQDSLEEVRITGLFLDEAVSSLDPLIEALVDMSHLRSLAISVNPGSHAESRRFMSEESLRELCQSSTTLQDLTLRAMHLDDNQCRTIASALTTSNFLTSLDIRQNAMITNEGYNAILGALEKNFDLWCSVMVDSENFQGKFNALIELNQAGRGDLLRSPTRSKLCQFLEKLSYDPSGEFFPFF